VIQPLVWGATVTGHHEPAAFGGKLVEAEDAVSIPEACRGYVMPLMEYQEKLGHHPYPAENIGAGISSFAFRCS
jgi:hypothetical protein